jgi:hypothetical protein
MFTVWCCHTNVQRLSHSLDGEWWCLAGYRLVKPTPCDICEAHMCLPGSWGEHWASKGGGYSHSEMFESSGGDWGVFGVKNGLYTRNLGKSVRIKW